MCRQTCISLRWTAFVAVAIAGCGSSAGGPPTPEDVVVTDSGPIQGLLADATRAFLGIPYAAPPVGPLRWKSPQKPSSWSNTIHANQASSACVQSLNPLTTSTSYEEDCLYLNVWTPHPVPKAAPVMLFLHGGAFLLGSGGDTWYDGTTLARRGVVVVTINYRLGAFGFLAHHALTTEDPAHPSSGNYGFEDQRFALQWVQRNIAAFGGDPSQVTIFGESAGAISVILHLLSPASAGLFTRAIVESALMFTQPVAGLKFQALPSAGVAGLPSAEDHGAAFAARLGCDTAADVLACMRGKKAKDVLAAESIGWLNLRGFAMSALWWPVVDGKNLADDPYALLRKGTFAKVPVVIGTNRDEGSFFEKYLPTIEPMNQTDYEAELTAGFGAHEPQVLAKYPAASYPSPADAAAAVFADSLFICDARRIARALASGGAPVFRYSFEHAPEVSIIAPNLGAHHAAELIFVFGAAPSHAGEQPLVKDIQGYWTRFAMTGDPNGAGAPAWPAWSAATDPYMKLDLPSQASMGLQASKCDFWDALYPTP